MKQGEMKMKAQEFMDLPNETKVLLTSPDYNEDKAIGEIVAKWEYSKYGTPYRVSHVRTLSLHPDNPYPKESMWSKKIGKVNPIHFSLVSVIK